MAIECDVLAAAPLRVDKDEDAAAANEVGAEVEFRADWDICCCWRYSGITEDGGVLVEESKEDEDGFCITVRLTPQIDFGNATRSSDLGLSPLSPAWTTPDSEDAFAFVVNFFVESDCSTWEECKGASLE